MARARRLMAAYRSDGTRSVADRLAASALRRLTAQEPELPLLPQDVVDSGSLRLVRPAGPSGESSLHVAWVLAPPGPGSGGHTTLFRMVQALEAAGHHCTLHLYDRRGVDVPASDRLIRTWWPLLRASVHDALAGLPEADVVVATSWYTAHVVAARTPFPTRRMYFVQDFEAFFYPRGAEYALAEDTYRFGFLMVAVGEMVARTLRRECGVDAVVAPFGCDHDVYRLKNTGARSGVAFYAVPGTPRRGYMLGVMALERFHEANPDQEIHVVGAAGVRLPFPATVHGRISPAALADVYNSCTSGLALSFTNISLTAAEMLACGVRPVVNDHPFARADLVSPAVHWARPTPVDLANALERAACGDAPAAAVAAAASAADWSWQAAREVVVRVVAGEAYSQPVSP